MAVNQQVHGLYEAHVDCSDLERAVQFYQEVLELPLAHIVESRRVAFFWLADDREAMLGVWEDTERPVARKHFAFRTSIENLKRMDEYLLSRGVTPRHYVEGDRAHLVVHAWMPAASIYFSDPDGNSLEYLALLPDEPRPEMSGVRWDEWEQLHGREW